MAEKDRGGDLPQRVPGAAQVGPVAPVALMLSEELRQRMLEAVRAERGGAAADDQERAAEDRTTELPGRLRRQDSAVDEEAGPVETRAVQPRAEKPRRRAGARLIALGLAVMVIAPLAAVAVDHFFSSPGAIREQAAAWVAEQVSPDVAVSCDAVMCAALQAQGFPASKLVVLGPTTPDPVPSVLVVETATVRELFGSSLATAWAPAVLASFGSGTGAITVRVVAPHGAAAYQAALNAGLASRKTSGAALLHASQITVSAAARSQLLAGQVDPRLLSALASLARHEQINIVRFGNLGPGASPGVLLRSADLAETIPAAHGDAAAYASALWAILSGADARIRPARAVSGPVQGRATFRVEFTAPSPLGNAGSGTA